MDWRKLPLICAIISAASGLKILAEKQLDTVYKMRESIHLLETIRLPEEQAVSLEAPKPEQVKPAEQPAPVAKKTLIMHSTDWCVYCRTDKAKIIPVWLRKGYNVTYVDDGKGVPGQTYPWYEITDETGTKKIHVGSLSAFR
jgi:hypothetical protein